MRKLVIVLVHWFLVAAVFLPAHAQKIPRLGILRAGAGPAPGESDVLIEALRKLGYIEGKIF